MGEVGETAKIFLRERIAWLVERDFGAYGEIRPARKSDGAPGRGAIFETDFASSRQLVSWVLSWQRNAAVLEPPELVAEANERRELLESRHSAELETADAVRRPAADQAVARSTRSNGRGDSVIRPERFARLVTLAGLLIEAARNERRLSVAEVRDELKISDEELREDIAVLNVVNFGGGTYVLYAEVADDEIEVDADTYGDSFARPARLLPLEAKALVAAIDLFGDHLPQAGLQSARAKDHRARSATTPPRRGSRSRGAATTPRSCAPSTRRSARTARWSSTTTRRTRTSSPSARSSPTGSSTAPRGGTSAAGTSARDDIRHFRLDRIKEAKLTGESSSRGPELEEHARRRALARSTARSRTRRSRASGSRPSERAGSARSARSSRSSPTAP